jgi:hypothetical protein
MKLANANKIRKQYIEELLTYFRCDGSSDSEDCGMITSNSFNFPVVADDGEEGWVEIVVKIPKEDDGYEKREEFQMKMKKKRRKKTGTSRSQGKEDCQGQGTQRKGEGVILRPFGVGPGDFFQLFFKKVLTFQSLWFIISM